MSRMRPNLDRVPLVLLLFVLVAVIVLNYFFSWGFNWVDYTIIGIIFLSAFVGYARGLIRAVFSLVGYIAAVICSVLFAEPVASFIMEKTRISDKIAEALEKVYSGFTVPAFNETVDFSVIEDSGELFEQFPALKEFLDENSVLGQLFNMVNPLGSGAGSLSNAVTSLADLLVFSVLKVISIILVFFAVKLVVVFAGGLINSVISQSSILSTTNKTIGMVLGVLIGCVIVYVAVSYVVPILGSLNIITIPREYNESVILERFFSYMKVV